MGPVQWWWRTWSKVIDPSREQELGDALQQAEAQRQRADRLASELSSETGALEKRAADAVGEVQRVRTQLSQVKSSEAKLQSRVAELEEAEAEVERLRQQLKEAETKRGEAERLRKQLKEAETKRGEAERLRKQLKEAETKRGETERLRKQLKEAETKRGETERLRARVDELEKLQQTSDTDTSGASDKDTSDTDTSDTSDTDTTPDVSGAPAVLGRSVEPDDLTVIEGVGPKIAGLLDDAGINTWRELSDADTERLRSILTDAGPRYRVHDPDSWPRQAALLAQGQWQEFKDLRADVRKS